MLPLTILLFLTIQALCQMNFTGHKLLAVVPTNDRELEYIQKLSENVNIDTWNIPARLNDEMKIHASPEVAKALENHLKDNGVKFYTVTDNIQKWIDKEREENDPNNEMAGRQEDFPLDVYHTYEAISAHLDSLESRYPGLAEVKLIGTTYEGNLIKGLKIGFAILNAFKPALWIDCGMHAREWVAPATCLYMIEQLLKGSDSDPEIQDMLQTFDWLIFPVMNPDGYKFTWSYNRMWRKNRAPSSAFNDTCRGTDLNRNFDAFFGGPGTSNNPCSDIYRGPSNFSEAESQAVRDSIISMKYYLKMYISIHSYSQVYMSPYGTSKNYPPDYEDHIKAMKAACTAIKETHGKHYGYGTIANTMYPASGSSADWAYAEANIKYSFAIELRDTGEQGFFISNTQIMPTAEENFNGIKAIVKIIQDEYQSRTESDAVGALAADAVQL